jgi:surface protein
MFYDAQNFNQSLCKTIPWDTSNVTNMSCMFYGAKNFNRYIANWDTSNVTDMSGMFMDAKNFNQVLSCEIGKWDTRNVINMDSLFYGAESFNSCVEYWNLRNVTDITHLFDNAKNFMRSLDTWILPLTASDYIYSCEFTKSDFYENVLYSYDVSKFFKIRYPSKAESYYKQNALLILCGNSILNIDLLRMIATF